jgi:hypothetical protein
MISATQAATNWASKMASSGEKMKAGIQAVTQSPTAKAAQRQQAYLDGVMRAVSSGKYAAALNRVSLESWKAAAINKGIPRVAQGAAEGKQRFQDFMTQFLPYVQQGVQALESMPRGGLEENIQRMVAMVRHNAAFQRSG